MGCINRNIVECKDNKVDLNDPAYAGINRNIVECKVFCKIIQKPWKKVLIETLWNVKIMNFKNKSMLSSINRNIVECKEIYRSRGTESKNCINRNIVECKDSWMRMKKQCERRINRNIVECKA